MKPGEPRLPTRLSFLGAWSVARSLGIRVRDLTNKSALERRIATALEVGFRGRPAPKDLTDYLQGFAARSDLIEEAQTIWGRLNREDRLEFGPDLEMAPSVASSRPEPAQLPSAQLEEAAVASPEDVSASYSEAVKRSPRVLVFHGQSHLDFLLEGSTLEVTERLADGGRTTFLELTSHEEALLQAIRRGNWANVPTRWVETFRLNPGTEKPFLGKSYEQRQRTLDSTAVQLHKGGTSKSDKTSRIIARLRSQNSQTFELLIRYTRSENTHLKFEQDVVIPLSKEVFESLWTFGGTSTELKKEVRQYTYGGQTVLIDRPGSAEISFPNREAHARFMEDLYASDEPRWLKPLV